MNRSKRHVVIGMVAASVAAPAFAQFGGLGGLGGGSKGGGDATDPGKLESDLKAVIQSTSLVLSKLADALGMQETSGKLLKNADDIKSGSIGVSDSTSQVSELTAAVTSEMEKNQKEGKKLDAASGAKAFEAVKPGIDTIILWASAAKAATKIDKGPMVVAKFSGLISALPKVPTALKNTGSAMKAGYDYLTFSGVDTKTLEAPLKNALSQMT